MLRMILLFVILGVFIACLFFFESLAIRQALNLVNFSAMTPKAISQKLESVFIIAPLTGIVAYPFAFFIGTIPATATAIAYWAILNFGTNKNFAPFNRGLIGGILGLVAAKIYGAAHPNLVVLESWTNIGPVWVLPSAICAICVRNIWYSKLFRKRPAVPH